MSRGTRSKTPPRSWPPVPALALTLTLMAASLAPPFPAGALSADSSFWTGRIGIIAETGVTLPTWEGPKAMTGGVVVGSYSLPGAIGGKLALEFHGGAWVVCQYNHSDYWAGTLTAHFKPGARLYFIDGPVSPYAASHVGLTLNRQTGTTDYGAGLGLDVQGGLVLVPGGAGFLIQVFAAYNVVTNMPRHRDNWDRSTGGFFVFGIGLGASIPTR